MFIPAVSQASASLFNARWRPVSVKEIKTKSWYVAVWYGLTLIKNYENCLVKALKFEVQGSTGKGRPKQTWKNK